MKTGETSGLQTISYIMAANIHINIYTFIIKL